MAFRIRWVCDDAFLTFRYIDNALSGHGLVYNPGEYVEGYTHFLWLCAVALFRGLGFDPVNVAQGLGLAAYAAVLLLFSLLALERKAATGRFFPLTVVALAVHYDFRVWATGGMETSLFTLLLCLAFAVGFLFRGDLRARLAASGFLLGLAVLTRPDAILFWVLSNMYLLLYEWLRQSAIRQALSRFAWLNGCFLAFVIPYAAWKYVYYGDLLPNTYYAKSAGSSYFSQGFYYLALYFQAYPSSIAALTVLVFFLIHSRSRPAGSSWRQFMRLFCAGRDHAALAAALGAVVIYSILFVARIGGDFMFARFVIPMVPLIYWIAERSLLKLRLPAWALGMVLTAACTLGICEKQLRDSLLTRVQENTLIPIFQRGIVDEHLVYTLPPDSKVGAFRNVIDLHRHIGEEIAPAMRELGARAVLIGTQNVLGYYARFPYCLDDFGLTDRFTARLPVAGRGRVGHEKSPPIAYLVEKGVQMAFVTDRETRFSHQLGNRPYRLARLEVSGLPTGLGIILIRYDKEWVDRFRQRFGARLQIVDFPQYLDIYIRDEMPGIHPTQVQEDLQDFEQYYFRHNSDPARKQRIDAFLQSAAGRRSAGP